MEFLALWSQQKELEKKIRLLLKKKKKKGLKKDIYETMTYTIIHIIGTEVDERGKGFGTKLIQKFISFAGSHHRSYDKDSNSFNEPAHGSELIIIKGDDGKS